MGSRDTPRSPDPDDWFAGPDRPRARRVRVDQAETVRVDADDWAAQSPRSRLQRPAFAASLPDRWVPVATGAVLFVILLVGWLSLSGVFSSSKPKPSATTTQITSTPTTPATTPVVSSVAAPATTLKPGDTGAQVKVLQRALASLGYTVGTVDGVYGTTTKTALAQFQTAAKLTADGVFGPATRTALIKALSRG